MLLTHTILRPGTVLRAVFLSGCWCWLGMACYDSSLHGDALTFWGKEHERKFHLAPGTHVKNWTKGDLDCPWTLGMVSRSGRRQAQSPVLSGGKHF